MTLRAPKATIRTQDDQSVAEPGLDPVVEFYQLLSPIRMVEALYADWHPDGLDIWLVVNGAAEIDRERIYQQEWALMQSFPGLGLNVYLLDRQETDPNMATELEQADIFLRFPQRSHA